jgi:hypothetical protein
MDCWMDYCMGYGMGYGIETEGHSPHAYLGGAGGWLKKKELWSLHTIGGFRGKIYMMVP